MLLRIVSHPQPGLLLRTDNKVLDSNYSIKDLMRPSRFGLLERVFRSSKTSKELQDNLQRRLVSWLQLPETLERFEVLFRSCGVDYISTQIDYPGQIELPASKSGITAILRYYTKDQTDQENVGRILVELDSLLRSTERVAGSPQV
jgi:hypothetical protein